MHGRKRKKSPLPFNEEGKEALEETLNQKKEGSSIETQNAIDAKNKAKKGETFVKEKGDLDHAHKEPSKKTSWVDSLTKRRGEEEEQEEMEEEDDGSISSRIRRARGMGRNIRSVGGPRGWRVRTF